MIRYSSFCCSVSSTELSVCNSMGNSYIFFTVNTDAKDDLVFLTVTIYCENSSFYFGYLLAHHLLCP